MGQYRISDQCASCWRHVTCLFQMRLFFIWSCNKMTQFPWIFIARADCREELDAAEDQMILGTYTDTTSLRHVDLQLMGDNYLYYRLKLYHSVWVFRNCDEKSKIKFFIFMPHCPMLVFFTGYIWLRKAAIHYITDMQDHLQAVDVKLIETVWGAAYCLLRIHGQCFTIYLQMQCFCIGNKL